MYLYIHFFQPERAKKSLLNERRWPEMLKLEVRSSTVLSQVE
jgi:hypothetical protein